MKKHVLILAALLVIFTSAFAGSDPLVSSDKKENKEVVVKKRGGGGAFEQGKSVVTLGYGFPNLMKVLFSVYSSYGGYSVTGIGPLHVKYEYGLTDNLGLGLSVTYVSFNASWTDPYGFGTSTPYTYGWKGSSLAFSPRVNYHFGHSDKFDPYVGLGIGYDAFSISYYTNQPGDPGLTFANVSPLAYEFTFGTRFYFTDNIGAYTEIGYSKSIIQFGVTAKF